MDYIDFILFCVTIKYDPLYTVKYIDLPSLSKTVPYTKCRVTSRPITYMIRQIFNTYGNVFMVFNPK